VETENSSRKDESEGKHLPIEALPDIAIRE